MSNMFKWVTRIENESYGMDYDSSESYYSGFRFIRYLSAISKMNLDDRKNMSRPQQ